MLKTNLINRRKFLKNGSKTLLGVTTSISFPSIIRSKSSQNPPNIVFIICDQMRGDALSCLGSSNARTPHLDKMAREGVLFKNCFANNPVCLPSRKSFFSGLYPHQHGSLTNNSGQSLPTLEGTLLGYLKQKGYRTGWIGKNHTYSNQALKGLDVTSIRAREPFRAYSKYVPPFWHSDTLWPEEECYPRKNTDEGIQFIQSSKKNQPFFLHLSYFDPHPPYMAPSEFSCRYNSKDMTIPPFISPDKLSPRLAEHARALHYDRIKDSDLTETMRYYYAAIEWGVDFQVGRILKSLETNGLLENTIVIFSADHGDFMGEHRMVRKGMFLYDALLHIPMIWYAPGTIAKGLRNSNLVQGVDLFPTLVDLTGGKLDQDLPGRSLKPFLKGTSPEEKDFSVFASAAYSDLSLNYFEHPEPPFNPDSDKPFHSRVEDLTWKAEQKTAQIRTGEWKLILNESRPPELYHMQGSWVEKENVALTKRYSEIRNKLEKELNAIWKW